MTEAEFLVRLRRLPLHPGALDLRDDAARLGDLVLTTDTLVEGVHYLSSDPAGDVAWKLVATNLSDLAAKGAVPVGVMLNYPLRASSLSYRASPAEAGAQLRDDYDEGQPDVTSAISTGPRPSPGKREGEEGGGWDSAFSPSCACPAEDGAQLRDDHGEGQPDVTSATSTGPRPSPGKRVEGEDSDWDAAFLRGFGHALTSFSASLLGGDTVSLPAHAPRVITLTAIGRSATAPIRSGARAGDALYVTGTIGDAGAGLRIAQGQEGPAELLAAYRRPQPRLVAGRALGSVVSAMMDVSDGLLIDAQRMAAASGLAVTLDLAAIPLSDGYRAFAGDDRTARLAAATAGDDYELLFAATPDGTLPCAATRIGWFAAGTGLAIVDDGAPIPLPGNLGFQHNG